MLEARFKDKQIRLTHRDWKSTSSDRFEESGIPLRLVAAKYLMVSIWQECDAKNRSYMSSFIMLKIRGHTPKGGDDTMLHTSTVSKDDIRNKKSSSLCGGEPDFIKHYPMLGIFQ